MDLTQIYKNIVKRNGFKLQRGTYVKHEGTETILYEHT